MTHPPSNTHFCGAGRRLCKAALAIVATVGAATVGTSVSAATPSTSSPEIAGEANDALAAYHRWSKSNNPVDYIEYATHRSTSAEMIAEELGVSGPEMSAEWADSDEGNQIAVLSAIGQLGVPYESIKSEPGVGFDCSGLTSWSYSQAQIEIPRVSGDQIRASSIIERDVAEPGDLVHYPGHVGIFLGADSYVHAPEPGRTVEAIRLPGRSLSFGDVTIGGDVTDI